jgi:hypothetical protein
MCNYLSRFLFDHINLATNMQKKDAFQKLEGSTIVVFKWKIFPVEGVS